MNEAKCAPEAQNESNPSGAVAAAAALVSLGAALLGCGVLGWTLVERRLGPGGLALAAMAPLVMFALVGLVLPVLHYRAGKGGRVPGGLVLFLAAAPLWVGLGVSLVSTVGLAADVELADSASAMTLIAVAMAEGVSAVGGGALGAGCLLMGSALASAIASMALRAPGRTMLASALGAVVGVPILGVLAYGVVTRDPLAYGLVGVGLMGMLAVAVGAAGVGRDERGHSGGLGGLVPLLVSLGAFSLVVGLLQRSFLLMFAAVANADPTMRGRFALAAAEEVAAYGMIRTLIPWVGLVGALVLAVWAMRQRRPSGWRVLGAVVSVAAFLGTVGLEAGVRAMTVAAYDELDRGVRWARSEGVRPAIVDTEGYGPSGAVGAVIFAEGLGAADGGPRSGLEPQALATSLEPIVSPRRVAPDWTDTPVGLTLGLDARATGTSVLAVLAAARDLGVSKIELVGLGAALWTDDERDVLTSVFPTCAPLEQSQLSVTVLVRPTSTPAEPGRDLPVVTLGAGASAEELLATLLEVEDADQQVYPIVALTGR